MKIQLKYAFNLLISRLVPAAFVLAVYASRAFVMQYEASLAVFPAIIPGACSHDLVKHLRVIACAVKPAGFRNPGNAKIRFSKKVKAFLNPVTQKVFNCRLMQRLSEKTAACAAAHHTGPGNVVQGNFFRVMSMDKARHLLYAFRQAGSGRRGA
jgi:hypothetical protein